MVQDELDTPILYYIITAKAVTELEDAPIIVANVIAESLKFSDVIFYNLTGLLPGTMYELTVVAVSTLEGGDVTVSQPSDSVLGITIAIFSEMGSLCFQL